LVFDRLLEELPHIVLLWEHSWQHVFLTLFLHQILRTCRLPVLPWWFWTITAWRPIFGTFVGVVSGWAISQRGPARRAMFFSWSLWVLMFLLGLILLGLLCWHVLDLSLHSAWCHWSYFRHLWDDSLPLWWNIWSFVPFWIQNRVYCFHLWVLIWQFLPILLILLPFMMFVYYLGSHIWNMRSVVLTIWLLVKRSSRGWALNLTVLISIALLPWSSLGIQIDILARFILVSSGVIIVQMLSTLVHVLRDKTSWCSVAFVGCLM
jgi:hypothetical protein